MEKRQHTTTREEHERMVQSLVTVRTYLKVRNKHRQHQTEEEIKEINAQINFLEHVLEFSATWNGVETQMFFPSLSPMKTFLCTRKLLRLGEFFQRPFAEISSELRGIGSEYPLLLKKLYEAYYLRLLRKQAAETTTFR